ncbi:hypothetical protein [Nocardia tengchongensis]|uniref:hypothetical protein n=1 Tax=Nocardia tengchongensis TaxID=2055889 RepID=UPI00360ECB14
MFPPNGRQPEGVSDDSSPADRKPDASMTALPPLAYGYVRDDLLSDRDPSFSDKILRAAARSLGYALGTVFHEPTPQNATLPPAFVDLVRECRRAEAHTVLTLPGHLSGMSVCRMVLLAILDVRAEAAVQEVALNRHATMEAVAG